MNRKIKKRIRKKDKKKRCYLSIFAFVMLLFVPVFVYASEIKGAFQIIKGYKSGETTVGKEKLRFFHGVTWGWELPTE